MFKNPIKRIGLLKTLKKTAKKITSGLFHGKKNEYELMTPINEPISNIATPNRNSSKISLEQNVNQLSSSSTDTHFITAMSFNIGDANITTRNPNFTANNRQDSLLNENIFVKILHKHLETDTALPDILILGLQEVPSNRVGKIQQEFEDELIKLNTNPIENNSKIVSKKYRFIDIDNHKKYITVCRFNYNILTMVMVSENIKDPEIDTDETITYCPTSIKSGKLGTKGFAVIKLKYKLYSQDARQEPPLYIVNLHAPFKSNEKTKEFFDILFSKLSGVPYSSNNIIIMGDYNSRSLISNAREYVKDIPPELCEFNSGSSTNNMTQRDNYCNIKTALEDLPLNNRTKLYGQVANADNTAGLRRRDELVANNTFSKLIKDNTNSVYSLLKEYPITFLPTYKRKTQKQLKQQLKKNITYHTYNTAKSNNLLRDVGQFSLEKGANLEKQFRLPGYADRITVIGDRIRLLAEHNLYSSIPVFGNDHIPVVSTFEVI
jgi:hypothetical protein